MTRTLLSAVALAAVAGCHKDPIITTRTVNVHVPAACLVDGNGYATYTGLGDFEAAPVQPGPFLRQQGTVLPQLDTRTRELLMGVSENGRQWAGRAPVGASGDVDVLVLTQSQSCALTGDVGTRPGSTLAQVGSRRALLTGGSGSPVPPTFVVELDTGVVAPVSRDLQTPRTGASVTAFGDGGLVAGGTGPSGQVLSSAEVFDAATGGFDATPVTLSEPRTHQGAVVLGGGQTLLVGGSSRADGAVVLSTLELVDPASASAHEEGLLQLEIARRDPAVVLLASGDVLVAGGFDGKGNAVSAFEWFGQGGTTRPIRTQSNVLPAATDITLAALPAGGALAVLAGTTGNDTWVIDASGLIEPAAPSGARLTTPRLFDGGGGAPALWTGAAWLQWQPYRASFSILSTSDAMPAHVGAAACAPEPGLAMWLDPAATRLTALRFDVRSAYSSLSVGGALTFAADTAPDRIAASGGIALDTGANQLTLAAAGGAGEAFPLSVFVTDRTYADVSITMSLPTAQAPLVVLRDELGKELVVGDAQDCPMAASGPRVTSLDVERRAGVVTWAVNGGAATSCHARLTDGARVSIGLRAGPAPAAVREMFVVRRDSP